MKEGFVDASTWGHLAQGKINRVETKVRFSEMLFLNEQSSESRRVPYFNTTIFYTNEKSLAEAQSHFNFYSRNKKNDNQFLLKQTDSGFLFQIDKIHMQSFLNWYRYFELPFSHYVENKDVEGDVKHLQITYEKGAFQSATFDFNKLGLTLNKALHLNHLKGQAFITPNNGYLSLDSHDVGLAVLKPYNKAITLTEVEGHYRWQKLTEGWRVIAEKSHITSPNLLFDSEFIFDWQGRLANSTLKMKSDFHLKHADELRPYLPKSSITEKGYHWIHQAFSNVEYLKGQIYVDGKIADVPFSNKQGQFLLRAEAYLPEFKFTDDWPIATEVKAHIEVNNEVMNTTLLEAKLGHNQMDGLKMVLAPLDQHKQFIYLHSATHLDAKESLAYLFKTPLKDKIDILKK